MMSYNFLDERARKIKEISKKAKKMKGRPERLKVLDSEAKSVYNRIVEIKDNQYREIEKEKREEAEKSAGETQKGGRRKVVLRHQ